MLSDKEIKHRYKAEFSKNPEKYFPVKFLQSLDLKRNRCEKCGKYFWNIDKNRTVCGNSECSDGYTFFKEKIARRRLNYIKTWKTISRILSNLNYKPIKRYPVVARWRDDIPFVEASIDNFIPYVTNGEVDPPENPLLVPQFCLRFNDIDNVGITGAHYTGFVMIGQHRFEPQENYNPDKYLQDLYQWFDKGLKIKKEKLTFHEDVWAGSSNFGPCIEIFAGGLELANQVYMQFKQTNDNHKDLKLKVLDMGLGHERNTWLSLRTNTAYEASFPSIIKKLRKITRIKEDKNLIKKFLPYSGILNIDEVSNIEERWKLIAKKIDYNIEDLKTSIQKQAALYSIAEHSRTLLVAISDSAMPSNVGGGYNLRMILRRALSLINKYKWNISLQDLTEEHAKYLKPLFPELKENLDEVNKIIEIEKSKFKATEQKSERIVLDLVKNKEDINENTLLKLYDGQGISPEIIVQQAKQLNKEIKIPEDFYLKVSQLHEKEEKQKEEKEQLDLENIPETEILYFEDYKKVKFKAKILKVIKNYIILNKTLFYPTSGGQMHDTGLIDNKNVIEVFKQHNIIIHVLDKEYDLQKGKEVKCSVDLDRRIQLSQHHTATHIVNAAARRILGKHINQAGAKKDIDKSHLDITHFESLTTEQESKIENEANRIVKEKIPIYTSFMLRNEAEKAFGMSIYQGGAVPGKKIRIVEIPEIDIEACAGTHLKNTSEVGMIKILRSVKVQDGIVRIEFTSGKKAVEEIKKEEEILKKVARLLDVSVEEVPSATESLFEVWKKARKTIKKNQKIDKKELEFKKPLKSNLSKKELIQKTAEILSVQPDHIINTIKRFQEELKEYKEKLFK